jgi:hypothetical protein
MSASGYREWPTDTGFAVGQAAAVLRIQEGG